MSEQVSALPGAHAHSTKEACASTYGGRQIVVSICVKALGADANDRSRPVTETVRIK